jgi:hypothetical protein
VPLVALYQIVLGLRPTAPDFKAYDLRPQLGDLKSLKASVYTKYGPIKVAINDGQIDWTSPGGVAATLVQSDGTRRTMPTSQAEQRWSIPL